MTSTLFTRQESKTTGQGRGRRRASRLSEQQIEALAERVSRPYPGNPVWPT
ncbi:MAG: hypothetical protein S0880_19520 [Actinomycetota bacterium]|nr:hypothetical protein [Actinomycetota bacterium]